MKPSKLRLSDLAALRGLQSGSDPIRSVPAERVKLRIEGHRDLPNPAQPPVHECRRPERGPCIWTHCPKQLRKGTCPLDHALEWKKFQEHS